MYFCFFASHSSVVAAHGVKIHQPPFIISRRGNASATIHCEQDDSTYPFMYWYKQSSNARMKMITHSLGVDNGKQQLTDFNIKHTSERPSLLKFTLQIHSVDVGETAVYYCASSLVVLFGSTIVGKGTRLTVLDQILLPVVKILRPSKAEDTKTKREKKKTTLVCVASDFYPDHVSVSWKCSAGKCDKAATDSAAKRVKEKYYRITSRLKVLTEIWEKPENTFTCSVTFYNGTKDIVFEHTIKGIQAENYLRITQKAKLSYCVFIVKSCTYGAFVGFVMWKLQVCDCSSQNSFMFPSSRLSTS
uniref:Ig-like domain-containing protein n=1 Tax=Salarias fasciatus TaxID=181472 RepID=A0A672H9F3_SALFA